jgi:hypothetical protein
LAKFIEGNFPKAGREFNIQKSDIDEFKNIKSIIEKKF